MQVVQPAKQVFKTSLIMPSFVWAHFELKGSKSDAYCKHCGAKLKRDGGSTSALAKHLKQVHRIVPQSDPEPSQPKKPALSQPPITNHVKKRTLEEVLTKLAVVDRIPIRTICGSEEMVSAFAAKGIQIPKSPATVMKHIRAHYAVIKQEIVRQIQDFLKAGGRPNVTLDEWTSAAAKKYMNVNVHCDTCAINLGLTRMKGSHPAKSCLGILKQRLQEFDLSLDADVLCIVTDGASVMKKMGTFTKTLHLLCLAHGENLAVQDVVYKKKRPVNTIEEEDADMSTEVEEVEEDEEEVVLPATDDEDEGSDDDEGDTVIEFVEEVKEVIELFKDLLSKVRKTVNKFRHSASKNDTLLKYTKEEHAKELTVIIDVKTRWNTVLDMIERFLLIHKSICKAFIDHPEGALQFDEFELTQLEDLKNALKPMKVATLSVCRNDANLLTADATFEWVLCKLDDQGTEIATRLAAALTKRLKERRDSTLFSLLRYLHDPISSKKAPRFELFKMASKASMKTLAEDILDRLFVMRETPETGEEDAGADIVNEETVEEEDEETLEGQLQAQLDKVTKSGKQELQLTSFSREFNNYEFTLDKTEKLTLLYKALKSIPPTSVMSERAFSAAGLFASKLRFRMNDETLDMFCFLRAYYSNKKVTSYE